MGRLKVGTGADGRSNAYARGDEPTLSTAHVSHGHGEHATGHAVPGNLARDGKEKAVHGIPYHSGMKRQQIDTAGVGGMGHGTAIIDGGLSIASSTAATPKFAHAYGGQVPKVRGPAPVGWNQKNRCGPIAKSLDDATPTDIHGKMLMDEAGQ